MIRITAVLVMLVSTSAFAQKIPAPSKGKQFTIVTTINQDIDMGMQMTTNSSSTNKVTVINADDKNYTLSNTVAKFVFNGNMMGKEIKFDSDKKEDMESEEGKQFGGMIGKTDTVVVDAKTGVANSAAEKATPEVKESDNPLTGMMGGMSEGNKGIASSIFFKIHGALTKGTTWTDSSTVNGMKTNTVYTITDVTNGVATVSSKGTVKGSSTMDVQGSSMEMSMDTKVNGIIVVDVKSSLVKKRNNNADITGNIDVMGQSMPFTSKTITETVYQ